MENVDLELLMISNMPIVVDKLTIYPTPIKEIAKFGYTLYNQGLQILCLNQSETQALIGKNISSFEFLQMGMLLDANIKILLNTLLSLIFKAKVEYLDSEQSFIIGNNTLNKDNFLEVTNIIGKINCISESTSESNENPSNEKARQLLEKRRKLRNKIIKHQKNNLLQIPELISVVAVSLKMPISQILEYNIYQLTDQFMRVISKEVYETNLNALLHGADNKDLDLKHWTQKASKNTE